MLPSSHFRAGWGLDIKFSFDKIETEKYYDKFQNDIKQGKWLSQEFFYIWLNCFHEKQFLVAELNDVLYNLIVIIITE